MRIVDVNLDEYGLTKDDFRMLYYFCRRYPKQKEQIQECYGIGSPALSDSPRGGCMSSITERQAENAIKFKECCRMIESAAKEAAPDDAVYACLMQHVTAGVDVINGAYGDDGKYYKVPMYRKGYRMVRRKFYFILAQKLGIK